MLSLLRNKKHVVDSVSPAFSRAETSGGGSGMGRPLEMICRKILLSCWNFCDLND